MNNKERITRLEDTVECLIDSMNALQVKMDKMLEGDMTTLPPPLKEWVDNDGSIPQYSEIIVELAMGNFIHRNGGNRDTSFNLDWEISNTTGDIVRYMILKR